MPLSEIQELSACSIRRNGSPVKIYVEIEEKKKHKHSKHSVDKHEKEVTHFTGPGAYGLSNQLPLGTMQAHPLLTATPAATDAAKLESEIRQTMATLLRQFNLLSSLVVTTSAPPPQPVQTPAPAPETPANGAADIRAIIEEVLANKTTLKPSHHHRSPSPMSSSSDSSSSSSSSHQSRAEKKGRNDK